MHLVIAGATSGTGHAVVKRLVAAIGAEQITCLARPTSDIRFLQSLHLPVVRGDVSEPGTLRGVLTPASIYLDMTDPRYYPVSIPELRHRGLSRAFFVTTTGIFSQFHRCSAIYKQAEALVKQSGLVYTILRPSMIYGHLRDRNMGKLITFLARSPIFPLFNAGRSLMQPVFVDDLAEGIVAAILGQHTENRDYNLAGPTGISYGEIIDTILAKLERKVLKINVNTTCAYYLVKACQWLPNFPINDEQVLRLKEDKVFDISEAIADLGYRPRHFNEGIAVEIDEMRRANLLR